MSAQSVREAFSDPYLTLVEGFSAHASENAANGQASEDRCTRPTAAAVHERLTEVELDVQSLRADIEQARTAIDDTLKNALRVPPEKPAATCPATPAIPPQPGSGVELPTPPRDPSTLVTRPSRESRVGAHRERRIRWRGALALGLGMTALAGILFGQPHYSSSNESAPKASPIVKNHTPLSADPQISHDRSLAPATGGPTEVKLPGMRQAPNVQSVRKMKAGDTIWGFAKSWLWEKSGKRPSNAQIASRTVYLMRLNGISDVQQYHLDVGTPITVEI